MPELNEFDDLPFGVQGDPTIEEKGGDYPTFEDGNYEVSGIFNYFGKGVNEDGVPFFVPQGDQMVARCNLRMVDGTQGPPITVTRAEMCALVAAFGGDPSKLPHQESPKFLFEALEMANLSRRVRIARVYKGWTRIHMIEGAAPDPGVLYVWEYVGARSPSGAEPVHFEKKDVPYKNEPEDFAYLKFRVVSDLYGAQTPYDGFIMDVKMFNPFDGTVGRDRAGRSVPNTRMGKKGGIPVDVERLLAFYKLFAPNLLGHNWESDPTKSEYGINELDNPLAVLDAAAKKTGKRAVAGISFTKPRDKKKTPSPKLDLLDFKAAQGAQVIDRTAQTTEEMSQPSELYLLVTAIDKLAQFPVFAETPKGANTINLDLTEKGREWAKAVLVPAWTALDLPIDSSGVRKIGLLTPEQCEALRKHLVPPFDVDEEKVAKAEEQGF